MHGVKRVWESRALSKVSTFLLVNHIVPFQLFWGLTVFFLFGFLAWQLTLIVMEYTAKPVVSEVRIQSEKSRFILLSKITFVLADDGLAFPKITICSYNPMKKSYVESE